MVEHIDDDRDGLVLAANSLGWLVFAAAVAGASAWGAYYWLGGIDTPVQKASVVGAALLGFFVVTWLNKIARIAIYAGIVVLVIWGANYWWTHH
jgi:hypothetical protein